MRWKMRNGQVIDVRDMTSSHLRNAMRACERKAHLHIEAHEYDLAESRVLWAWTFADEMRRRNITPAMELLDVKLQEWLNDHARARDFQDMYPAPYDIDDMPFG